MKWRLSLINTIIRAKANNRLGQKDMVIRDIYSGANCITVIIAVIKRSYIFIVKDRDSHFIAHILCPLDKSVESDHNPINKTNKTNKTVHCT